MDLLTIYGLVAVGLMLVFYAAEARSHWFVLAFAIACLMASSYGFLQGAWPFGLVEAVWSVLAARRWWLRLKTADRLADFHRIVQSGATSSGNSRLESEIQDRTPCKLRQ